MFRNIKKLNGCKVLVVDGSLSVREVIARCLHEVCEIYTVESAEPDLILMNWMLGRIPGLDACKKIQSMPSLSEIPIIFVTANTNETHQELCWDAGAIDFVGKPIVPKTLINRVKTHLRYKLQTDALKRDSFIDGLTKIYNRKFFNIEIVRLLKQYSRFKQASSMIMIDIDYFKEYKDTYGHLKGDDTLKAIAKELNDNLRRPLDLVLRYGGEEFVIVLPNTELKGASVIADKVICAVKNLNLAHSKGFSDVMTISAGISAAEGFNVCDVNTFINNADKAFYLAKENGINRSYPEFISC
ncbi:GGDEF domain-containing response regulator [Pseudoalteromonas denitrificans]|uniref:diguanylate cyclase n=1 Tax=Pseudoalteromonas denitrificans DSM 6059 TaxID=1123010 RepID=A0A1I1MYY4_9GAMM|nr:diguanylate cyclase [Pseudoalteromonas denitrificans]SFC90306.1 diguanylate cyclase (GGDEF) domain-containing protein [Pseudoalteromonas denitrificans DSM 6059]